MSEHDPYLVEGPPPGTFTLKQVLALFKMSKQNLYTSGLNRRLFRYRIAKNVILYAQLDVMQWADYLEDRAALIQAGRLSPTHPLVDEDLFMGIMSGAVDVPDEEEIE